MPLLRGCSGDASSVREETEEDKNQNLRLPDPRLIAGLHLVDRGFGCEAREAAGNLELQFHTQYVVGDLCRIRACERGIVLHHRACCMRPHGYFELAMTRAMLLMRIFLNWRPTTG